MNELILAKYGEIVLKGNNKSSFEKLLIQNIKKKLKSMGEFDIKRMQSTIYIQPKDSSPENIDVYMEKMSQVFGISALCRCAICEKNFDDIVKVAIEYFENILPYTKTFKVECKRADKRFPMKSPEICTELGYQLLKAFPNLIVDVKNPQVTVTVEIRDTNAYIHAGNVEGAGGLPVGSSGRALALLSGGIDSPVACYMMAKRGLQISAIHYVSPPYTSERARLKVETLCEKLTEYCGTIAFFCVPFTEIQEAIKEHCPEEYFTLIMRRLMMEIAQRIAKKQFCEALITGESVGQVASQTLKAIACTDAVCKIPVFRPVIGMDKLEIINVARKIDTFETSTLPYEDCCTVFTPKHPKTKPTIEEVENAQNKFDFTPLIERAVNGTTLIVKYAN
ncbi:MAG: tRNA uracil 4-sulfurtransferase ThiI [Oscillospiraceae bacterium]